MKSFLSYQRITFIPYGLVHFCHAHTNSLDELLNLDCLLIQLRSEVTPMWYQFGIAGGMPIKSLDELLNYPQDECIIEVLDYWLRKRSEVSKPTWKDVAKVLKEIGLSKLAEDISSVYTIGKSSLQVICMLMPIYLHGNIILYATSNM